jgi:hypothetical protein
MSDSGKPLPDDFRVGKKVTKQGTVFTEPTDEDWRRWALEDEWDNMMYGNRWGWKDER